MSKMTVFESRTGNLSCSPREFYDFAGDIRNFERFIPANTINAWNAEKDSCSFSVSMLGKVVVAISEKEEFSRIVFKGTALSDNNFNINVNIEENSDHMAAVKVILEAELNQMLKMIASGPINQFLGILIDEMEKFRKWKDIR